MDFIQWESNKLLQLETSSFSTQLSINNKSCELFIHSNNKDSKLTEYLSNWQKDMEWRDLIVYNNGDKYFLIKSAKPVILQTNNQGFVSSCKLKIEKIEDITRHIKILNILN